MNQDPSLLFYLRSSVSLAFLLAMSADLIGIAQSSALAETPAAIKVEQSSKKQAEELPPVLQRLNQQMHLVLRGMTAHQRKDLGPLIIFEEGKMKLLKKNQEVAAFSIMPPLEYQKLKVFGHVFFATSIQLQRSELSDEDREQWSSEMLKEIDLAITEIDTMGLSAALTESQRGLLQATQALISEAKSARPNTQRLKRYINEQLPAVWHGARRSASLHLELIHSQAKQLLGLLNQDERQRVRAHLYGGRGARRDHLVIQYLSWLFGERSGRESQRIVFSENIQDHDRALDMFAKYCVESELAAFIFDDPERLDRDLLGDVTRELLKEWPDAIDSMNTVPLPAE